MRRVYLIAPIVLVLTLLVGCASHGSRGSPVAPEPSARATAPLPGPGDGVETLLARAERAASDRAATLRIRAARLLVAHGKPQQARQTLVAVQAQTLPAPARRRLAVLNAELALADERPERARVLLAAQPASPPDSFDAETRAWEHGVRARLREARGDTLAAVRERSARSVLLRGEARARNQQLLWRNLRALPTIELERLASDASRSVLRGWGELELLARDTYASVDAQQRAVEQWQRRRPDHPAARDLPGELARLAALARRQPDHVALLLPLSGPLAAAGEAIRNGFLAAQLDAHSLGMSQLTTTVHDTGERPAREAYLEAVDAGADLVVGPLAKDAVTELAGMARRDAPVLALNVLPAGRQAPTTSGARLFQLGLIPEDEGRQAAERAWAAGHRSALVLASQAPWADRVYTAFRERWTQLGGRLVSTARFDTVGEIDETVADALMIQASEQRAKALRGALNKRFEFQPRRRTDVDFAFLAVSPVAARTLKPTLAYYYAEDLPVYASSHVFNGGAGAGTQAGADLDGIRFCQMPWRLRPFEIRTKITRAWSDAGGSKAAFYALGVDAYRLHERLPALTAEDARYYGVTGTLTLKASGRFERELMWAMIRNGRAVAMPQITPPAL